MPTQPGGQFPGSPQPEPGFMLSRRDCERLRELLRRVETQPRFDTGDVSPRDSGYRDAAQQFAKVVSSTTLGTYYDALLYRRDLSGAGPRWTPLPEPIWLESPNGLPLVQGTYYRAFGQDQDQGRQVFETVDAGGAFIALASGGIAALTGTTPGKATCTIYQIVTNSLVAVQPGLQETVFNLSTTAVTAGWYVPIVLDEFGSWIVAPPGSGGGGSLTVKGVNDTPVTYASCSEIDFDQATGFSLGGGICTVSAVDASATHRGVVNTSTQSYSGNKTFLGSMIVGAFPATSPQTISVYGTVAAEPASLYAGGTDLVELTVENLIVVNSNCGLPGLTMSSLDKTSGAASQIDFVFDPQHGRAVLIGFGAAYCVYSTSFLVGVSGTGGGGDTFAGGICVALGAGGGGGSQPPVSALMLGVIP